MFSVLCKVFFLDGGSTTIPIQKTDTVEVLLAAVVEKLEIQHESNTFCLYEVNREWQSYLRPDVLPGEVKNSWNNDPDCYFLLRKRFFMHPELPCDDPSAETFIFAQVREDVLASRYEPTADEAILLASYCVQIDFGNHNPTHHKPGYLTRTIKNFIPEQLLPSRSPQAWEEAIFMKHQELVDKSPEECKKAYLEVCRTWHYYGSTFFPVKYVSDGNRKLGIKVFISLNVQGIHVLRNPSKEVLATFAYNDVLSWGSSPRTFAFTAGEEHAQSKHTFDTRMGSEISSVIQGYIDLIIEEMNEVVEEDEPKVEETVPEPEPAEEQPAPAEE
ncbi:hypothetical protein PCE1_000677 [Barthelona sp. PCE]